MLITTNPQLTLWETQNRDHDNESATSRHNVSRRPWRRSLPGADRRRLPS